MVGEVLTAEDTVNVRLSIPGRFLSFAIGSFGSRLCENTGDCLSF
jgi:hypothetical protein